MGLVERDGVTLGRWCFSWQAQGNGESEAGMGREGGLGICIGEQGEER